MEQAEEESIRSKVFIPKKVFLSRMVSNSETDTNTSFSIGQSALDMLAQAVTPKGEESGSQISIPDDLRISFSEIEDGSLPLDDLDFNCSPSPDIDLSSTNIMSIEGGKELREDKDLQRITSVISSTSESHDKTMFPQRNSNNSGLNYSCDSSQQRHSSDSFKKLETVGRLSFKYENKHDKDNLVSAGSSMKLTCSEAGTYSKAQNKSDLDTVSQLTWASLTKSEAPQVSTVGSSGEVPMRKKISARRGVKSKHMENKLCQVCGDVAAGFYCGAFICEACKKFYMRAYKQDKLKYVCLRDKNCVITKESRVQCQYCRFQKCVGLNMYCPKQGEESTNKETNMADIPCRVCSAPSSGFHFGAITCEGCKGFFRRMAKEREPEKYQCNKNGKCEINMITRNLCKACRYKQCQTAGMSVEGSRIGRQPNSIKHFISMEFKTQVKPDVDELVSSEFDNTPVQIKQEPSDVPEPDDNLKSDELSFWDDIVTPEYQPLTDEDMPAKTSTQVVSATYSSTQPVATYSSTQPVSATYSSTQPVSATYSSTQPVNTNTSEAKVNNITPKFVHSQMDELWSLSSTKSQTQAALHQKPPTSPSGSINLTQSQLPCTTQPQKLRQPTPSFPPTSIVHPTQQFQRTPQPAKPQQPPTFLPPTRSVRPSQQFQTAPQPPKPQQSPTSISPTPSVCPLQQQFQFTPQPLKLQQASPLHPSTPSDCPLQQQFQFTPQPLRPQQPAPLPSPRLAHQLQPQYQSIPQPPKSRQAALLTPPRPLFSPLSRPQAAPFKPQSTTNHVEQAKTSAEDLFSSVRVTSPVVLASNGSRRPDGLPPSCPDGPDQMEEFLAKIVEAGKVLQLLNYRVFDADITPATSMNVEDIKSLFKSKYMDPRVGNHITSNVDMSIFSTKESTWNYMMTNFHHNTYITIRFAKLVPGFKSLLLNDQVKLIQYSIYPIELLNMSKVYDPVSKQYNYFTYTKEEENIMMEQFPMLRVFQDHLLHIGEMVTSFNFTDEEFAFLSALLLFPAEIHGLENPKAVDELQNQISSALQYYEEKTFPDGLTRYGVLLVRVAELVQCLLQHNLAIGLLLTNNPSIQVPQLFHELIIESIKEGQNT